MTEDESTACDKVAPAIRVRTLPGEQGEDYDVITCIAGTAFEMPHEDMRRGLPATDGRLFALTTTNLAIDHTRIQEQKVP